MEDKIDIVIPWVDGNDLVWQQERNKYATESGIDNSIVRYRDWDNLQYFFRGIEKFAPWVNKIYFITYGHLPVWLNTENPKLVIVNHRDFIPAEYLPTFNSNTIELNINRIKDLSNKFILFNDDIFLTNNVTQGDFFKNNLPCDNAIISCNIPTGTIVDNIILNNTTIINKYFSMKNVIKENKHNWYTLKNGKQLYKNYTLVHYSNFAGLWFNHLANSYLKSNFDIVWDKEYSKLNETCLNRFRSKNDLNQWIIKDWQICLNQISPRNINFGKYYEIGRDDQKIKDAILNKKYKMLCLNDVIYDYDFNQEKEFINNLLNQIMPEKSSFEK